MQTAPLVSYAAGAVLGVVGVTLWLWLVVSRGVIIERQHELPAIFSDYVSVKRREGTTREVTRESSLQVSAPLRSELSPSTIFPPHPAKTTASVKIPRRVIP